MAELPGLDALLRDGGGVTVERGDDGEDSDDIESHRVDLRLIADAADRRRPLEEERSDEPRIRWLYLSGASERLPERDREAGRLYLFLAARPVRPGR